MILDEIWFDVNTVITNSVVYFGAEATATLAVDIDLEVTSSELRNYCRYRWDGSYQGEPLPTGVYNFRIVYAKYVGGPKNYDEVGTVTLIR